jgi:pimeloyl-ACP methyl ester carboxylesterase
MTKAGPNFAFLHGGGQGGWVWRETQSALRAQSAGALRPMLTLDAPGCGAKRGRATDALGVDDIVAELVQEVVSAGLRDVVLVGHSQAGCILPRMARARPDLFRRLVYLTCSSPLAGQTVIEMIGSGLQGETPDAVGWPVDPATHGLEARYDAMFCNDMAPAQAAAFLAGLGGDAWPASSYTHTDWTCGDAGVPASYVVCLRDRALPVPWQLVFAGRFGARRLVRLDAGHQAMNTRPHALAEILLCEAVRDASEEGA